MNINIHDVTKIELVATYLNNCGSRTFRITSKVWIGEGQVEQQVELTLYGETGILDQLPKSSGFRAFDGPGYVGSDDFNDDFTEGAAL